MNFTAYSMLTRNGRRLVSRLENGREVFELVPESDLPADLPAVREWKLYCVRSDFDHFELWRHLGELDWRRDWRRGRRVASGARRRRGLLAVVRRAAP